MAILGILAIVFAVVIVAFVVAMRQSQNRTSRYRPRSEERKSRDASAGYSPYKDMPEMNRRKDAAVFIGIIIIFIVISVLSFFL